jgi:hypothetical protein
LQNFERDFLEIVFLKTATHILIEHCIEAIKLIFGLHMQKTSSYHRTQAFFSKLIFTFLIHSFIKKNGKNGIFENFSFMEKSLNTTIAKGILFDAIYLIFV